MHGNFGSDCLKGLDRDLSLHGRKRDVTAVVATVEMNALEDGIGLIPRIS